jgi:hypothetical protein
MNLTEKALRLLTISESIIDAIDSHDTTSFKASVLDFVKLKKGIRTSLGSRRRANYKFARREIRASEAGVKLYCHR